MGARVVLDLAQPLRIWVDGVEIAATLTEWRLMLVLVELSPECVAWAELDAALWDCTAAVEAGAISWHKRRLQRRLPAWLAGAIESRRGCGLRLALPAGEGRIVGRDLGHRYHLTSRAEPTAGRSAAAGARRPERGAILERPTGR